MKKLFIFSFFLLNFKFCFGIDTPAKQALLYDLETNTIIFEKNADDLMSPSSMSKVMTIYYLFKKIQDGEVSLNDKFKVSKKAWKKGGSRMFLNVNSLVTIEELIRGIIVQSGNDACITLAEGLSGSEEEFAEELNILAKEIGLKNAFFKNSTGWPDPDHLMTSRDLLNLAIRTIEDFPDLYHYYSEKEFKYNDIKQSNRNPLIYSNPIADGLKTGHTSLGGYGLVASVKKDDRRLIIVLNGLKSNNQRRKESERLVRVGFNQFKNINLVEQQTTILNIPVWGGKKKLLPIYSEQDIKITVPKKLKKNLKYFIKYNSPAIAPIKKNEKVAEFVIKKSNNEVLKKYDLFAENEIRELNFFGRIFQNFKYLIFGETALLR